MEFNSCILLYSKYSVSSKKLMDFITLSGLDLTFLIKLQVVCIDNEEVRKRIIKNKQIGITSVPSLLLIYPDGGLEKYDYDAVFRWFEEVIKKLTPKQVVIEPEPEKTYEKTYESKYDNNDKKIKNKKIAKKPALTSIDDLISEEDEDNIDEDNEVVKDDDNDRYKNKKPTKLIRVNKDNYEEDASLFQGTPPNNRENKKSAIKKSESGTDIMSKAKELAKGRESEMKPPPGHPLAQNN